ncbi:MAG: hypothetical protein H5U36_03070 [Candidatus Caldatribacterium sp.]|nr:hypothetical protein [Candidatus Caldatribacterium sp.]
MKVTHRVLKLSLGIGAGEVVQQHWEIAGAVFDHDTTRLEELVETHLRQKEYPEYFK